MPRSARHIVAGLVYHVLNRSAARLTIFDGPGSYAAFERLMAQAHQRTPVRLLTYCLMPNHWHLVLWPQTADQVTNFTRWLTNTHAMHFRRTTQTTGEGHLYQGRFKAIPVASDEYLLRLCRYVERNPLRAGLATRAEHWPWSGLWRRLSSPAANAPPLSPWPLPVPPNWLQTVNQPDNDAELQAIRRSLRLGRPLGSEAWAQALGLPTPDGPRRRRRRRRLASPAS